MPNNKQEQLFTDFGDDRASQPDLLSAGLGTETAAQKADSAAGSKEPSVIDNSIIWGKRMLETRRPLVLVVSGLAIALIIVLVVFFVNQVGTVTFNEPIHRYDNGQRIDYDKGAVLRRTDDSYFLNSAGSEKQIDPTPIYFDAADHLFLPSQMIVVSPEQSRAPVRTGYMTTVQQEEDLTFSAQVNGKQVNLGSGFLFDGVNTYVFLDPVTIIWGDNQVECPAFSYAVVHYGLRLEIYPAGQDDAIVVLQHDEVNVLAAATKNGYSVDLSKDILKLPEGDLLLFTQPSLLEFIS